MNDSRPKTASRFRLGVGPCATLACLLEVNAPKPGNVHRGADFDDATLNDFAASAVAIGPVLQNAIDHSLGEVVLRCVEATMSVSQTNTNLGTILLLAPLASVADDALSEDGLGRFLHELTPMDAQDVYRAIRMANPGGLGKSEMMDLHDYPPSSLLDAMQAAAARDMVALQYVTEFSTVFEDVLPRIVASVSSGLPLPTSIVHTHVQLLAEFGDSLIGRKCGEEMSKECAARAAQVNEVHLRWTAKAERYEAGAYAAGDVHVTQISVSIQKSVCSRL